MRSMTSSNPSLFAKPRRVVVCVCAGKKGGLSCICREAGGAKGGRRRRLWCGRAAVGENAMC